MIVNIHILQDIGYSTGQSNSILTTMGSLMVNRTMRSPNSMRQIRYFNLDNGIKALEKYLIHHSTTHRQSILKALKKLKEQ